MATNNNSLLLNGQSYEFFYNAIATALSGNPDFANQFPEDFGITLISFLASLSASMDYFTTRKLQEAYLETAQSPLGVYTGAVSITGQLASYNPSTATVAYMLNTYLQEANGQIEYTLPVNSIFNIKKCKKI